MKKKTTILLVEDEEITANVQSDQLAKKGYIVKHLDTGEKAVEYTLKNRNSLDLILMDINLGSGIYGTEAAEQILEKTDIPIVFLSSHTSGEFVEKAEKLSSYGYVVKNPGIAVLDASIKMALRLFDEKKEAEQHKIKLKEGEEKYRLITENISDIVWMSDLNFNITYISNSVEKVKGISVQQYLEMKLTDLFPENTLKIFNDTIAEEIEKERNPDIDKNRSRVLEVEYYDINKSLKWASISVTFLRNSKGEPIGLLGVTRDITEKKIADDEISTLASMLDLAPNAITVHDFNGNFLYTNEHNLKLHGYSRDEMMRMSLQEIDLPESAALINSRIKQIKEKGEASFEVMHYRKDGSSFPLMIYVKKVSWYGEKALLSIGTDISEKKKTEKALKESEERLDLAMSVTNEGIWDWNLITNETYFDDRYYTMAGYKPGEFAHNFEAWASLVHTDDLPVAKKAIKEYLTGKSSIYNTEFRFRKKNGDWMWINGKGKIVERDTDNKPTRLVGTHTDITIQKKAEQALSESEKKYRTLAENAFDAIYMLQGRNFKYVNKQFCRLSEYSYSELTADDFDFSKLLTEESKIIIEKRYIDRRKGKELDNVVEFEIKTKKGKVVDVEASTTIIKAGEHPLILGIVRDVSKIKKAKELENEIVIAKKAAEFKQKFLANMSHEIRTPLAGMIGFIDLLADTKLKEEQKLYVDTLRQSGENLREIINLILDYSKIESGQITLKHEIFTLKSLFENVTGLFSSICHKNIELKTTISRQIPKYIKTDKNRLNQILNNLVSNAVKFTEKGTISINAKLAEPRDSSNYYPESDTVKIKIEVKDTGPGISTELQKELFKPFSQADAPEIGYFEGTGLGLSICKELAEMLGGEIGVNSKPGKGSTFWFTFTAKAVDKPEKKCDIAIMQEKYKEAPACSILLVDDKKVNQMVVSLMLKHHGHNVDTAGNGQEAIEKYESGKYDIILMDIQMPVMDGVEATKKLKQKYKKIAPCIY